MSGYVVALISIDFLKGRTLLPVNPMFIAVDVRTACPMYAARKRGLHSLNGWLSNQLDARDARDAYGGCPRSVAGSYGAHGTCSIVRPSNIHIYS